MMVMTIPWHFLGLQGQWRRVATFDYTDPQIALWGPWVVVSLAGGVTLLASAALFVWNLVPARASAALSPPPGYAFALAAHPPHRVPAALNGFFLWNILVAVLMAAAYGYPILQFFTNASPGALVHPLSGG
jgi:cytochrome c oxidase subunit 1